MLPRTSTWRTRTRTSVLLALILPSLAAAQAADVRFGVMYECPDPLRLKIHSCTGSDASASCDVQGYNLTRLARHAPATRQQVVELLRPCHLQTRAEAVADAGGSSGAAATQNESNGIKVGDAIEVLTGFGWTPAKVLAVSGNSYRVMTNGAMVTKDYPTEVRRLGAPTARDRANGQYRLHDAVEVNVQGRWMAGKVIASSGNEFQVELPGNRTAWAGPENLRPGVEPPAAAAPKAGVPPKPGLASCAGKIEGRYATTGSAMASFTATFRSGKATLTDMGGNDEVFECWIGDDKIYLRQPAHPNLDFTMDINDDGTLQTPFGEIRKKGK
jgi:hypothetical protein